MTCEFNQPLPGSKNIPPQKPGKNPESQAIPPVASGDMAVEALALWGWWKHILNEWQWGRNRFMILHPNLWLKNLPGILVTLNWIISDNSFTKQQPSVHPSFEKQASPKSQTHSPGVVFLLKVTSSVTLPKTNIAPENRPSQKETSIPTIHFQVQTCCLLSGRVIQSYWWLKLWAWKSHLAPRFSSPTLGGGGGSLTCAWSFRNGTRYSRCQHALLAATTDMTWHPENDSFGKRKCSLQL